MVTNWCLDCREGIYTCTGAFLVHELVHFPSIFLFSLDGVGDWEELIQYTMSNTSFLSIFFFMYQEPFMLL